MALAFVAALILFCAPRKLKQLPVSEGQELSALKTEESVTSNSNDVLPFHKMILQVRGLLPLALAYACHKGSRYWFFYWGPDWLVEAGGFSPATAAYLTVALGYYYKC